MQSGTAVILETYIQPLMAISFALPCLLMSRRLWRVWRDPLSIDDGAWVRIGIGVFVMEFVLMHAGILLASLALEGGSWDSQLGSTLLLTFFYGIFAIAISAGFKSRMLLHSFLWMIAGRYLALVIGISSQAASLLMAHAIIAGIIYFGMVILSIFLPWPQFGISDEIATRTRMPNASGLWIDQPHRAIGAATVYFLLLAIAELAILSWIDPHRIHLS